MKEKIIEVVLFVVPVIGELITAIGVLISIKRFAKKKLQKRIEEVSEANQLKEMRRELAEIKREIQEMRGKRK